MAGANSSAIGAIMKVIELQNTEMSKWLNLVHGAPNFVIWIEKPDSDPVVQQFKIVPKNKGEFWIAGNTHLNCGKVIPSVFIVDTNSGGTLINVYWLIDNNWWDFQERPAVEMILGLDFDEIFPFDWKYKVPLEVDIFH